MDGATPEVAKIGNDGLVGADIFMGGNSGTSRIIVQKRWFWLSSQNECRERLIRN